MTSECLSENVPEVVNIKTLKGRFSSQCKSETYCWTKKLNRGKITGYTTTGYFLLLEKSKLNAG